MKNLTMKAIVPALLSCAMLTFAGGSAEAYMKYVGYHKLSERQARSVAEQVHPGRVVGEMGGHTANGDKAYRFHIQNRSGTYAVGVDAVNGRVVENLKEGRRIHRRRPTEMQRLFAPTHFG
jgi:hypothetical protein